MQKKDPSLVGNWQMPTMQTVTFHQDGTVLLDKKLPGRYTLLPDHKILIENESSKVISTYSFKDENTLLIGKEDGLMDELRRITRK